MHLKKKNKISIIHPSIDDKDLLAAFPVFCFIFSNIFRYSIFNFIKRSNMVVMSKYLLFYKTHLTYQSIAH